MGNHFSLYSNVGECEEVKKIKLLWDAHFYWDENCKCYKYYSKREGLTDKILPRNTIACVEKYKYTPDIPNFISALGVRDEDHSVYKYYSTIDGYTYDMTYLFDEHFRQRKSFIIFLE